MSEKRDSANAGRSRQIESASQLRVNICRAACQNPDPPKWFRVLGFGFRGLGFRGLGFRVL